MAYKIEFIPEALEDFIDLLLSLKKKEEVNNDLIQKT